MTVEAAVAAMDTHGRRFAQGQMDQRLIVKPQNTEEQRHRVRPQSMANGSVQHLANNVEDVLRMVISTGFARSEARKVNNQ
jgi:uncharacterized protein